MGVSHMPEPCFMKRPPDMKAAASGMYLRDT